MEHAVANNDMLPFVMRYRETVVSLVRFYVRSVSNDLKTRDSDSTVIYKNTDVEVQQRKMMSLSL